MDSDHNNSYLVDEVINLIISDCLDSKRIELSSTQKLIDMLKLEYGVLFQKDNRTYYSESITRMIGSSSISTEAGVIGEGDYFEITEVPQFVQKIMEVVETHDDLITAAKLCNYPIKQLFSPDYVETSPNYKNFVESICEAIDPYLSMLSYNTRDGISRIEKAEQEMSDLADLHSKLGAFLNEE